MASGFKNFINKLNQPIGGGGKTSDKKRKANLIGMDLTEDGFDLNILEEKMQ